MKYFILFSFCLLIGNGYAQENYWNKFTDSGWEPAPAGYKIETAAQLAQLASLVNQGNSFEGITFTLIADIDLSAHYWNPVAEDNTRSFCGIFDGNNHKIKGLKIDNSLNDYGGVYSALFGRAGGGCQIRNVILEDGEIKGGMGDGALTASLVADMNVRTGGKNVSIRNCHNTGVKVTAGSGTRGGRTAGLIASVLVNPEDGSAVEVSMEGCTVTEPVSSVSTSSSTGGLVGWISLTGAGTRLNITECAGGNDVINFLDYTGGLIGRIQASGGSSFHLENSRFKGKVLGDGGYTGGLVGRLTAREESRAVISKCSVTLQELKGDKSNTNDIVGKNDNGVLTDNRVLP